VSAEEIDHIRRKPTPEDAPESTIGKGGDPLGTARADL